MQIVLPDERGSGFSAPVPLSRVSLAQMSGDIEGLKRHLGISKIVLLGVSYGGFLALDYALRYPHSLAALILMVTAPSYRCLDEVRRGISRFQDKTLKHYAIKLLEGRVFSGKEYKETILRLLPLYYNRADVRGARQTMNGQRFNAGILRWWFRKGWYQFDVESRLKNIHVPTLIVGGEKDWITPVSQSRLMHKKIPDSRLVIFKQGKHMLINDENVRFVREVKKFLKDERI